MPATARGGRDWRIPRPANNSVPEQIAALAQLRDSGVLSSAEFEAKKADLLRRM